MSLSPKELSNVLEQIFDHMQAKGIHIEPFRDQLKKILMEDLRNNNELTFEDLKNAEVKKKLIGCVTELLIHGKSDAYNNLVNDLSSKENKQNPDEKFDNKLCAQLLFLTVLTTLNNQKIQQAMILTPDELKMQMKAHLKKHNYASENASDVDKSAKTNELEAQFDFLMRALYGVGKAGEQGVIFEPGNQMGIPNITRPDPNSVAFMVDANTYNSNKADYLGLENEVKVNELSEGIDLDPHVTPSLGPPA